ncbi:MAG: hypothetical protein CMI21_07525 [Opitutae bacterium]|nr:hypothetical protein [Opitutae bacterium]
MSRLHLIALSGLLSLAGCELQQKATPYEFGDEATPQSESPPQTAPTPVPQPTPSSFGEASRQDPNKPFDPVDGKVVKGKPRRPFTEVQFPQ